MKRLFKSAISVFLIMSFLSLFNAGAMEIEYDESQDDSGAIQIITMDYDTGNERVAKIIYPDASSSDGAYGSYDEDIIHEGYNPGLPVAEEDNGSISARDIICPGEKAQIMADPNVYPYSAIMHLLSGYDLDNNGTIDKWFAGTGFLVYKDVMVTACHNFYSLQYQCRAKECRIYPRQNSSGHSSSFYYPKEWACSTAYTKQGNKDYDWLVASLHSDLGSKNGYFAYASSENLLGKKLTISGYPAETEEKQFYQFKDDGYVVDAKDYEISYTNNTEGGQSGSPVYKLGSEAIAFAIHTRGMPGYNSGNRITKHVCGVINDRIVESMYK